MIPTAFYESNRMEIWPSKGFHEGSLEGLTVLKMCHIRAGGTATLTAGGPNSFTSLVLYGNKDLVARTLEEGERIYELIGKYRVKELSANS